MYQPRFYREWINRELKKFNVAYRETDLLILADQKRAEFCFNIVKGLRQVLDRYSVAHPFFLKSLVPVRVTAQAPLAIRQMAASAAAVGVGPLAAVAGLFAEQVGRQLLNYSREVIVENGGDIFLSLEKDCKIAIFAGENSPFQDQLALKLSAAQTPLGICTSSGTFGPSFSLGRADAVTVLSPSATLADAAATAAANQIRVKGDIDRVLAWAQGVEGITGIVVIKDDQIGLWGEVELTGRQSSSLPRSGKENG